MKWEGSGIALGRPNSPVASETGRDLLRRYKVVVLITILFVSFFELPMYGNVVDERLLAKYTYFAYFGLLLPLLIFDFRGFLAFISTRYAHWVLALLGLLFLHWAYALFDGAIDRSGLIATNLQYLVLAVGLGYGFSVADMSKVQSVFPFLCVAVATAVLFDFLVPGRFYEFGTEGTVLGRAAATFINPNKAGEVLLLLLLLTLPVTRPGIRTGLLLYVGLCIVVTFSRAALLGWGLIWVLLIGFRLVPRHSVIVAAVLMFSLPLLLISFESYLAGRDDLLGGLRNILDRLDFVQSRAADDHSALERAEVLEAGVELFANNPLVGAGATSTHFWAHRGSTHNQPLLMAAELGIIGIALYVWLISILWRGKYFFEASFQKIATIVIVVISLFSHNMFDAFYCLIAIALVASERPSGGVEQFKLGTEAYVRHRRPI